MVRDLVQNVAALCRDERRLKAGVGRFLGVAGFAGFMAIGAHTKIALPWTPVPFTLQTFFAVLAGAFLGPLDGALAIMTYLGVGALSFPIFAGTGAVGLAYFSGITGGYLLGFLAAAVFVGFVVEWTNNFYVHLASFACGMAIIHLLGVVHMSYVLHIPMLKAAELGSLPFIPGDILKAGAALTAFMWMRSHACGVKWKYRMPWCK
jgi:biotin transport system substrate-specific component